MKESINGMVDDQQADLKDDVKTSLNDPPADFSDKENEPPQAKSDKVNMRPSIRVQMDHPKDLIQRDPSKMVTTRSREEEVCVEQPKRHVHSWK
ncbi:hypothetical protein KIW84_063580 [Lathyrus oleraceus]|uniref:Uncharacterized protein n=1 Tax=Pisum sativum TaxID=3888 RepID=A0A9D4W9X1_PEA|nr:hypothetical protein KIW84_063580 [Pisum sativum]